MVPVGEGRREGPGVAVGDEFLRGRGTGRATDDVLEKSPKTVKEHGACDRCGDEKDDNDGDANYLPCFAGVIGVAFRGRWEDRRRRGYDDVDGGGFGRGSGTGLFYRGLEG